MKNDYMIASEESVMKRMLCLVLVTLSLLCLAACKPKKADSGSGMPTVLNQSEYAIYQNVFFNKKADDYVGKVSTKEGILTVLQDEWNHVSRYYVWGYMDATKCCDWQWEFVPSDPSSLPTPGSRVRMTGTLVHDEAALDNYWFTDCTVETVTEYASPQADFDVDTSTMDATLERVQLLNVQYFPEVFEGKTVCFYGRIMNTRTVQHPYYDNAWTQAFSTKAQVPAIGTLVLITGTWHDGEITEAKLTATSDY